MGKKDYDEVPIQYDPDFRGPTANRSCTDIFFLILFIIFLIGWAGVGIYAISNGDISSIVQPLDSLGRKCGIDKEVRDKPYMVFFDLMKCAENSQMGKCDTAQVCVEKCPTEDFDFEKPAAKKSDVEFLRRNLVCKPEVNKSEEIVDLRTARSLMENRKCASRQIRSRPSVSKICIPTNVDEMSLEIEGVTPAAVRSAFRSAKRAAREAVNLEALGAQMVEDFVESWWKILLVLLGSMIVCLLYIVLMRWIAGPMVWISIIGVILLLASGTAAAFILYSQYTGNEATLALAVGIILAVILLLLLLLLMCGYKQIGVSIALIKVGARAIGSAKSTVLFPLIPWIMQSIVIGFTVLVALELASFGGVPTLAPFTVKNSHLWNCTEQAGQLKSSLSCDPELFKHCSRISNGNVEVFSVDKFDPYTDCRRDSDNEDKDKSDTSGYFHAYNVFGFFWTMVFISALGEMVLAITFATWYWTYDKRDVPYFTLTVSIFKVYRYHVGTLAFGSLILAICKIIRALLKRNSNTGNSACNHIMCLCRCLFCCLERIIKFITKNAYIMCAIHGTNFCTSAKNAFSLIMRNTGQFIIADQITGLLLFMSKFIVTLIMGGIAYLVFAYDWDAMNDAILNHGLGPVILVIIVTYFIACIFFGVYDMAIDTITLCFLEDCERNDGSPQRPYFMSRELLEIMDKSNKS